MVFNVGLSISWSSLITTRKRVIQCVTAEMLSTPPSAAITERASAA
ncbi:Uncharacterised protein [Shigella sonnei]|nr:Uncharacterised protein [Shigella sonnei]